MSELTEGLTDEEKDTIERVKEKLLGPEKVMWAMNASASNLNEATRLYIARHTAFKFGFSGFTASGQYTQQGEIKNAKS